MARESDRPPAADASGTGSQDASPGSRRRRRRPLTWLVAGTGLILVGAGATVASAAAEAPLRLQVAGGDAPINEGAGDPGSIQAHNSPTVVRNPTDASNVVVANRVDLQQFSCALHVSSDGGATWRQRQLPVPSDAGDHCHAPDADFGPQGTLYVSYVTLDGQANTPNAVWLVTSQDGGESLSEPTRVGGQGWFQVRLRADPRERSRLYLTWLDVAETEPLAIAEPGQPIRSAVSSDGGETWSEPVQVNADARERVVAPSPAIGPDGVWYVAYLDLRGDRLDYHGTHEGRGGPPYDGQWQLVMARSADEGETWQETEVATLTPTERFIVFFPPYPSVAVDPRGQRVYVAFAGGRAAEDPKAGADVFVWASPDAGSSWRDAVRVNHTPPADGSRQWLPQAAVAPTGRVDVVYYDGRRTPDSAFAEVSLQASVDGAGTFTERVNLSEEPFDARIGFGAFRGMADLGSRLGLVSARDHARAVWADTRAGTRATGKQDLRQAIVSVTGGPAWSRQVLSGVRLGGAVLVLLGVGVLTGWVIGRRPRAPGRSQATSPDR